MNNSMLMQVMLNTLYYTVVTICIITLPTLIVGLMISILQAATQINEITMTFIPKLIVMFFVLWLAGPWFLHQLVEINKQIFLHINEYIQ
jgi:flagellar biosynthesis protein FliQ